MVLLWHRSSYIIVYMPFIANYLCYAYYCVFGILKVVSENLPWQKIVGNFFSG
jgi:hypothetical protein